MGWSSEDGFGESGEVDFLSEAISVFCKERVGGNMACENIVCSQVSAVERKEEVAEPGVVLNKCLEDRM
jgi:hypothetical protein